MHYISRAAKVGVAPELRYPGPQALLLAGASVDVRDAWGHTALYWAAARGHEAATAVLVGAKVRS